MEGVAKTVLKFCTSLQLTQSGTFRASSARVSLPCKSLFVTFSSSAAFKANRLLESAAIAVNNVTKLAEGLGNDANRLTDAVIPVTEQMAVTLVRVEEVLKQASQGDGTIGQLMSNPDLYRSLEEAARKLETTLGQLELLLQKIRDEGLQVGM